MWLGDSLESFDDDVTLRNVDREYFRGDSGNDAALVLERAFARHCGGRSNALEPFGGQPLPDTAHQQGDVCTLPTAVGVELVEYQEPQAGAVPNDFAVYL